jgi:bacterioferritin (cytochrome b1)
MKENEKLLEVFNALLAEDQIIMTNYSIYEDITDSKIYQGKLNNYNTLTIEEMQLTNRIIERTIFWMFCQRHPNLIL